tara:strand:+ start:19783 stop:20307 length:525 start_codon:yes stop_codon:yes gene_type:complete
LSQLADNPFWDYSLVHYGRSEVARACLELQEGVGANVNLVLFCCWLGSFGQVLTVQDLDEAEEVIRDWNEQVVEPLRGVRRFVRSEFAGFADQEWPQEVKQLELRAERVVQNRLCNWWQTKYGSSRDTGSTNRSEPGGEQQLQNLNLYLSRTSDITINYGSPLVWPVASAKPKN